MNWKDVACNFNCLVDIEAHLKVVQVVHLSSLRVVISCKWCKIQYRRCHYRLLIGVKHDLLNSSNSIIYCKPFQVEFLYSCAAIDKLSTDILRHVIPLQQLSFLCC